MSSMGKPAAVELVSATSDVRGVVGTGPLAPLHDPLKVVTRLFPGQTQSPPTCPRFTYTSQLLPSPPSVSSRPGWGNLPQRTPSHFDMDRRGS